MKAIDKLEKEFAECRESLNRYGDVLGSPVLGALKDFCNQNSEFAQAVEQSDKTIGDCLKAISNGIASAISDLEVYTKAVEFYFKGATVHMTLTVDLGDEGYSSKPPITVFANKKIELSLDSFLDF